MKPIYLDHAATTPTDSRVVEAMIPWLSNDFGNASSIHALGRKAHVAVEESREIIASYLHCTPAEIIFTSGGTESDNTVIHSISQLHKKNHIITSNAEHHAVLHTVEGLSAQKVTILPVNELGLVNLSDIEKTITNETGLISLMHVNNENGAIHQLNEIGKLAKRYEVYFHSDAVQSIGKYPIHVDELNVDYLSASGHKLYGPKGIGFLYVRAGSELSPLMKGGSQERKRRAGTLNVAGIVGLGKAIELAVLEMKERAAYIAELKVYFEMKLKERLGYFIQFNNPTNSDAYHIINVSFTSPKNIYLDGEMLLLNLDIDGIYCSNGSACTSGAVEPSHVLLAMGIEPKIAKSSLRFSLGKDNTKAQIDYVSDSLYKILKRMGLFSE